MIPAHRYSPEMIASLAAVIVAGAGSIDTFAEARRRWRKTLALHLTIGDESYLTGDTVISDIDFTHTGWDVPARSTTRRRSTWISSTGCSGISRSAP